MAEQAAAAAAADCDSAGRSRQRRRRRASVRVVNDVARLETAGATPRRCVDRDGNARRDTRHGGVVEAPGVAGRLAFLLMSDALK